MGERARSSVSEHPFGNHPGRIIEIVDSLTVEEPADADGGATRVAMLVAAYLPVVGGAQRQLAQLIVARRAALGEHLDVANRPVGALARVLFQRPAVGPARQRPQRLVDVDVSQRVQEADARLAPPVNIWSSAAPSRGLSWKNAPPAAEPEGLLYWEYLNLDFTGPALISIAPVW